VKKHLAIAIALVAAAVIAVLTLSHPPKSSVVPRQHLILMRPFQPVCHKETGAMPEAEGDKTKSLRPLVFCRYCRIPCIPVLNDV